MSHSWLIITFSWFGTASLQYINTGGPGAESILSSQDSPFHYPLPYTSYFDQPSRSEFDAFQSDLPNNDNYNIYSPEQIDTVQRKRRTIDDDKEAIRERRWLPNLVDTDKTSYIENDEKVKMGPFGPGYNEIEENATDILDPVQKKNFSPWGGKRDRPVAEHTWTWKRASNLREPSMPKRVRFSPWGGKRSGPMIYKPGSKGSKVIFSTSMPELTRIVSNMSPKGRTLNLAGFQFIPDVDERHPIKVLALSSVDTYDKTLRDALPFKAFLETLPKMYKPGHPYSEVHLKKDGKRKVKFSAWGGKRSPPIIGPIWSPAPHDVKESTLNTILLIRNQGSDETTKALQ